MFGGIDFSSNVQEQISGAFRSCGCKEYENGRRSSLLNAKVRETNENVSKNHTSYYAKCSQQFQRDQMRNWNRYWEGSSWDT